MSPRVMILMRLVCRGSSRVRKVSESKSNAVSVEVPLLKPNCFLLRLSAML